MPTDLDPAFQTATTLQHDRYCVGCGYNVRGLMPEGACPECGVMISRTLSAERFSRANHRWLARLRLGVWLMAAGMVLAIAWTVLSWVPRRTYNWDLVRWLSRPEVMRYIEVLRILGVWLATTPEAGPRRADSPRLLAGAARWLCVSAYVAPILQQCWVTTPMGRADYLVWYAFTVIGFAGMACLLLALRQYALRNIDSSSARSLGAAVGLGVIDIVCMITVMLLSATVQAWPAWAWTGLYLVALAYGAAWVWAVVSFGVRLRSTSRLQRPTVRLLGTVAVVAVALVIGGLAGFMAGEVVLIQARRLGDKDAVAALWRLSWSLSELGLVAGAMVLPSSLVILRRKWTRSR